MKQDMFNCLITLVAVGTLCLVFFLDAMQDFFLEVGPMRSVVGLRGVFAGDLCQCDVLCVVG